MIAGILLLLLGLPDPALAAEAYRAGRFAEAHAFYEAALAEPGADLGPLLYNLGNCAFRLGRPAEAVLHYRRALRRMPRDPEITFNLRLASRSLDLPAQPGDGAGALAFLDRLTPGEALALAAALEAAGLFGFVLFRRRPGTRRTLLVLALAGILLAARLGHALYGTDPEGVVLPAEVALRPEPQSGLAPTHHLRAGESVRILAMSDRWMHVVHLRGSGWTERASVGVVD